MGTFLVIVRRDIQNLVRKRSFLASAFVFPVALVGLLGLLNEGLYGGGMSGWDVCAVNILVYMGGYASMLATNSFMERTLRPTNLRVLYAPVPLADVYVGKIVATTIFCGTGYLLDTAVLSLCGVRLGPALGMGLAPLVIAVTLASTSIGVLICCLVRDEPTANRILSLVVNILAVAGGVFFGIEGFGGAAATVASLSPFTWLRAAAFQWVWEARVIPLTIATLAALALAALAMIGCRAAFRTEDYV